MRVSRLYIAGILAIGAVVAWIGCHDDLPTGPPAHKSMPSSDHIAAAAEYTAAFDAFVARENIANTCGSTSCDSTYYTYHPDCALLNFQYWSSYYSFSRCAMTTPLFDFDTRNLPDSAEITDVVLRLYWYESECFSAPTQPDEPDCETWPMGGGDHTVMGLGSFFKSMNITTGGDSLVPTKTLPPILCGSSEFTVGMTGQDFSRSYPISIPKWIDVDVNDLISRTTFSRYILDREPNVQGDSLLTHYFEAVEHEDAHPPTLRVKYKMAYSTCLDGSVTHGNQNCSSCSDADFAFDASSQSATVKSDSSQIGLCGEGQMALIFDTASLEESHTITSATLRFRVKTNTGLDVATARLRVYSKPLSGSCPGSLGNGDFIGCGSGYTDLGLITVSGTGEKTFTIPNAESNLNQTGPTKFILVDTSVFTSADGAQSTEIFANETGTATYRPQLSVVYN